MGVGRGGPGIKPRLYKPEASNQATYAIGVEDGMLFNWCRKRECIFKLVSEEIIDF